MQENLETLSSEDTVVVEDAVVVEESTTEVNSTTEPLLTDDGELVISDEDFPDFDGNLETLQQQQQKDVVEGYKDIVSLLEDSLNKINEEMETRLEELKVSRKEEMATEEYKALPREEKIAKRNKYNLQKEYMILVTKCIRAVRTQKPLIDFIKSQNIPYWYADMKHLKEEYKKFRSYRRRHKFKGMNFDTFFSITKGKENQPAIRKLTAFAYGLVRYANYLDKEHKGNYLALRMTYFLYTTMMINLALGNLATSKSTVVNKIVDSYIHD